MKKSLAIIILTFLVLSLFSSCKTTKANDTITPNPPTGTTVKNEKETIETTKNEVVPETEKKEETKTSQETKKAEEANTAAPQTAAPVTTSSKPKAQETQKTVQQNKPTKKTEPTTAVSTTRAELNISRDEAKAIALSHAGLAETDISRYKSELDRERKTIVYEIEFDSGKFEYEYEVNADTGKVIKAEKEIRD